MQILAATSPQPFATTCHLQGCATSAGAVPRPTTSLGKMSNSSALPELQAAGIKLPCSAQ